MSTISKIQEAAQVLEMVTSELTYLPSPEQRKAKSAFWARFNDNPICEPSEISLAIALRFVADSRLSKWWGQEGFRAWFSNQDEFRQRMEYLSNLALDRLEGIIADPKANASAQVNAIKLIMEVTRKMPPKFSKEIYVDEKIGQMDRKQLEEYIRKNVRLVEAPPESSEENPLTDSQKSDTVD